MARALLIASLVALVGMFLGPGTGWTYWTATAGGEGAAATGTMLPPTEVTGSVSEEPGTVEVTWTEAVAPGGGPGQGYFLTRTREGDGTTSAACGTSPSAPTTSLKCQDQPQPDGDYHYVVTAIHQTWTAASNPSNTVNIDTLAPEAPSAPQLTTASDTGSSPTDRVTNDPTPTLTGTAEPGSTVTVFAVGTAVGTGVATAGTYSITTSVLGEGSQTLTAAATDGAGNTGPASSGTQVTIDTLRPAVTVDQQAGQADPTNSEPINYGVRFSEPVTGFTADDVELRAPAGATALVTGTGATYNVAVTAMTTDGTVTIRVASEAAHDLAGNGNHPSTSTDDSVTRDTAAPAAPSAPTLTAQSDSGTSDSDRITHVTTPTFTGTAEAGTTVTLYSGGVAVGSGAAATEGSYAIATTSLAEGTATITAAATDAAGNTSSPSTGTMITIDATAPAAPSAPDLIAGSDSWSPQAAGTTDTDNITNDTTPTFAGTAVPDSTVTLYSDGMFLTSGVAGGGSYSITPGTLAQQAQTVNATASDAAGNASAASPGITVTIDSTAPTVAITHVTYSNGLVTTTGTAGIGGGDAGNVHVVICSENAFPCSSGSTDYAGTATVNQTTGGWTNTSSDLQTCLLLVCTGPGQIYVQATQADHAGNIGISNTVPRSYS
ncbi:Ig-like domain-containing protein [Nocardioides gansuensis]|uniref:Ig-like domain-containing protein n=1 Tax=Nocardioides gansuensis TaxID=2138300 RepID=UPI00140223E8|nr:Ig-like domain-containing protein [Nocardioides gansuensis]